MEVLFDNRQEKFPYPEDLEDLLQSAVELCLEEEEVTKDIEVSISFVDNDEIQKLNRDYRGIDRATDVLSFPQYENIKEVENPICLGDIVISLEKALEQSKEYGHSFKREVAFLTVHSMFHLMGYDHDTPENTSIMREKEEKVLQQLGVKRD